MTQRGFIVPLVALAVALLALTVFAAVNVIGDLRSGVRSARDAARLDLAAATAEARLTHLLLTEPLGPRGIMVGADRASAATPTDAQPGRLRAASGARIAELKLDDTPYALRDLGVTLSAQDAAGLLNLNANQEAALARLLVLEGAPGDARALAAALADYVDEDDLRRPNGAEAQEYRRARLPTPRNNLLRSTGEAFNALGWAGAFTRAERDALTAVTIAAPQARMLNLNTAPPLVLRAALNLDSRGAAYVVDARAQRPFQSLQEAIERTGQGANAGELAAGGTPARAVRLTTRFDDGRSGYVSETWVELTPDGAERPFARHSGSMKRSSAAETRRIDGLPDSPALLATRER